MSTSLTAALQAVPQASAPAAMSAPPTGPTANGFALTLQQLSQQHQPAPPQLSANAVPTQALSAVGGSAKPQAVQPKQQHNGHASRSEQAVHSSQSTSQAQASSAADKRVQSTGGQTAQHTGKQTKSSDSNANSTPGQAGNGLPPTIPVLPLSVRMDAAPPSRMTGNGAATSPPKGVNVGPHAKSSATDGNSGRPGSNSWQQLLADASLFNTKGAGSGQTGVSAAFTALASVRGGGVTATAGGLPAGPLMQLVATTGQPSSGLAPGTPPPRLDSLVLHRS
ncbi:hypothetical protein [Acidihalobacter yilgarnensis]|uniref:hypothetical protein n=1 Tax=Acidihalobacter yilgarnensis TaxID=2819280 RepID=UPI0012EAB785|nr:hypothetical protein [Acidihalobacter yilgarnensis]